MKNLRAICEGKASFVLQGRTILGADRLFPFDLHSAARLESAHTRRVLAGNHSTSVVVGLDGKRSHRLGCHINALQFQIGFICETVSRVRFATSPQQRFLARLGCSDNEVEQRKVLECKFPVSYSCYL